MKFTTLYIALSTLVASSSSLSPPSSDELKIDILKQVECKRKSQKGDAISVHYKGTLEDGTKFDSSWDRGTPLPFVIGQNQVITCWEEGLLDMCIGEKRKLWCAPSIAYGERGIGPIPPNAALIFETELVDIAGVKKEESGGDDADDGEDVLEKDEL
ncbi:FPR2 [Candida theae]|uniref:peptidylprolyl isomerase n=1 Tax=Candida theae TaxID=1198502 RepID=A0AAD5FWG7_9ASCO|nr:FPR2 [Candida theae]KAI5948881.1 FPR2 [Candida theae]